MDDGRALYREPYKGRDPLPRRRILDAIARRHGIILERGISRRLLVDCEGDALDSVIAASTAFRVSAGPVGFAVPNARERLLEGHVYLAC